MSREYYKKECHVRRACNTINGIARGRAYSDRSGDTLRRELAALMDRASVAQGV